MRQAKSILILSIIASIFFAGCASNRGTDAPNQETTTTTTTKTTSATTIPITSNIYNMSLVRSLQTEATAGSAFTVTLNLTFNGTRKPGLLGITEIYPTNWNVTNITGGGLLRQKRSAIEWLFFPPLFGSQAQNSTLSYQLTVPKDIRGTYFFDSEVLIGTNQETKIAGQDNITIK